MSKPLLLVDIDGVISLFGFDPQAPPAGRFMVVEGIAHFVSAPAGQYLRQLGQAYELAWCSGWEEKANEHLPDALGLPQPLPHLSFDARPTTGAHWKLGAVKEFVGDVRPVAWIDDAHNQATEAWAAARPGPTTLVHTQSAVGLSQAHVDTLVAWTQRLPQSGGRNSRSHLP